MKKILRLTTTLMLLIFLGGNAWGQTTLPFTFSGPWNSTSPTTGLTRSNTDTYSSNGEAKLTSTGNWIKINFSGTPDKLSLWMKAYSDWGSNDNHVRVYEATSDLGTTEANWGTPIADFDNTFVTNSGVNSGDIQLSGTTTWISIFYTKVLQNVGIDNISITAGTSGPTISVLPSTLTNFTYVAGSGPSAEQSFTVQGSDLTADISIAATTNYEISTGTGGSFSATDPITLTQTGGSVSSTTIYVRLKAGLSVGDYNNEDVTASSTGADNKTVTCSGSVTAPPAPDAPVATAATAVGSNGFTANWNASAGATGYYLDVYHTGGSSVATDLIISEYIEGSSNNKAIEIYNGTGSTVDLSNYSIRKQTNGAGAFRGDLPLVGSLTNGEVYVLAHSSSNATILAQADQTTGSVPMDFNGNDAVALYKSGVQIDVVGIVDQVSDWGKDVTLVRKSSVTSPTTSYSISDWDSYAVDTFTYLGSHTMGSGAVYDLTNQSVGNVTSYAVTSLSPGTTYYYVVRATNASGTSGNSNKIEVTTTGGVTAPTITSPTATSITDVSATLGGDITSDGGSSITERGTVWKTSAGVTISDNKLAEGGTSTGVFTHSRSSLPSGSQIFYRAYATNVIGTTLSDESSFYTLATEPSAHPTGFTATANSSSEITVNWTDANPAADAYLIKGSDVSYGAIDAPVDGTAEANSTLVQNVTSGVQTFQFTGLAASTTYYFKIYPYNGSATTVNYKTDETIEQATATTEAYAGASLIISEVADPITYQGRFVEIYNADDTDIDFVNETWYLSKQSNGSSESWADIQLTGTIAAGSTYVIAYGTDFSNFYSAYGLVPDMSSGSISGNGDDGYFLYSGGNHASGTLVDAYGAINEDGSGKPWEYENSKAVRLNTINTPNTTWTDSEWNIISSCDVNRMTPLLHPATAWNGDAAKSSDWTAVANWDNGLPGALISAKIPSNLTTYPTIASAATVNILWLGDGATLLGGENLTVNGTAFFEKQIAGYSAVGEPDGWYAIAPPVSGSIATSTFVPIENEDDFYVYDQATNYWLNYFDASNPPALFDNFDPGTGYLVAYAPANAGLLIAAGTLNAAASYSPALSNSNTAWNLIGNPYPSNVTWADVTKTLVSSPKIMNVNTGAWEDMGSEVEVGQGIFVYAEDGSASITFETADHTHASGLKEVSAQLTFKALFADNLDVKLLLQINNEATTNYEWQHDARYFYPVTTIPYLCATTDDQVWVSKYVFSPGGQTTIIPLHFTVAQSQSITFALDNFTRDAGISRLTLEDTFANKFVELSEGDTYTFTADPSDDPDRFKLHAVTTTGITESTIDGISIYANGNSLYLNSNAARTAQVEMYNVTGQLTFSKKVSLGGLTQITPQFTTGWYIVKVRTQQGVATQKVFIKSNQ